MAFEMQYKDDIQKSLESSYTKEADKAVVEGSFARDVFNATSIEHEQTREDIRLMLQAAFASTSWGEYLTARAAEFGVDRKAATRAIVTLHVTGTAGVKVPIRSLFAVKDGVNFQTTAEAYLDSKGAADIPAECLTAGTAGNVLAHTINQIPMSITGVQSVDNIAAAYDGFDEEDDGDLLKRLLVYVRTPATSGNTGHYYNWAMSVSGIGGAKVVPLWKGPGTVQVIIVNTEQDAASDNLIKKVSDYIDSVRPIGATVTVTTPNYISINVSVAVKILDTSADFQKVIKERLMKYFNENGFESSYVSYAQVGRTILDTGILKDYKDLKLNGGDVNVPFNVNQLPRLGTLEVTTYAD